jgi:hypothetical protein
MGARNRLNAAAINGVLFIAGLVALLTGSWIVFGVIAVALIATSLHAGDIRLRSRR